MKRIWKHTVIALLGACVLVGNLAPVISYADGDNGTVTKSEIRLQFESPMDADAVYNDTHHPLVFDYPYGVYAFETEVGKNQLITVSVQQDRGVQFAGVQEHGTKYRSLYTIELPIEVERFHNNEFVTPKELDLEGTSVEYLRMEYGYSLFSCTVSYSFRDPQPLDFKIMKPRGQSDARVVWIDQDGEYHKKQVAWKQTEPAWKETEQGWVFIDPSIQEEPLKSQWIVFEGKTYYVDEQGIRVEHKWKKIGGQWYYFTYGGARVTNEWVKDGGKWYYVGHNGGLLYSRWVFYREKWYYLKKDGNMAQSSWQLYKGKWYYLSSEGTMSQNSWQMYRNQWYHFSSNGAMSQNSWVWYKNKCYYLQEDGSMATSRWIGNDYVDASGAWIKR